MEARPVSYSFHSVDGDFVWHNESICLYEQAQRGFLFFDDGYWSYSFVDGFSA
jgi:hypothetical protein